MVRWAMVGSAGEGGVGDEGADAVEELRAIAAGAEGGVGGEAAGDAVAEEDIARALSEVMGVEMRTALL
jgi:hypothetical protein